MGSRSLGGLRARLVLFALLIGVPAVALWWYSFDQLRASARQEAEGRSLQTGRAVLRELEALVDGARQLLPALAANAEVLSRDGEACSREFAVLLRGYPQYINFAAVSTDGLIFCSALPFTPPVDVSDRRYIQEAMATGEFAIGEFQIGRVTGVPSINFGIPAFDSQGRLVAVVIAALDLAFMNEVAATADLPAGATLTVFDRNATILARAPDPQGLVGDSVPEADVVEHALQSTSESSFQATGLDGVEKIFTVVPLGLGRSGASAYLTVGIPLEQVYAKVAAVERQQLIFLVVALALGATSLWLVGERMIVRRVDALVQATRAIADGRLETRSGIGGSDEIARLGREFDEMAGRLQDREAALLQATGELRRVNRALVLLSACNQVLIRASDEASLIQQLCETIVAQGGFLLAWVGMGESDPERTLKILGRAGAAVGYLEETPLTLAETPSHQGPGGAAIRTGSTTVIDDIWKADVDPTWRRLASRYGFASAIGLPLRRDGRVIGALSIYAGEPDGFDPEEVLLLEELADDLSYGLEALRRDTERRRAQADVVRLEAFHRGIVENVAEGIVLFDPDGNFTYLNSAAEDLLGHPAGELLGKNWKTTVSPADHPAVEQRRAVRQPGEVDRYEVTLIRKDGEVFQARVGSTSLFEAGAFIGTLSVFGDLTAERKYQRKVELQERLASVGQLAAGIAHDFNNIIGAVILFGEMLQAEEGLPASARERVRLIVEQGHRAAELTQQILDYGRKSIVERRPMDLLNHLREFERLVGRTLPEAIMVRIEADGGEHIVNADPGRIQQALLNLALNARDAMPDGGEIAFRLTPLEVLAEAPPYRDMRAGSWLLLSVQDTGSGIPPAILPHIFEPFFTTKPIGEGTGLGLSQVYGIVKQHDGYIDVQSTPGQGTTFLIYLPLISAPSPEVAAASQTPVLQGNGETILVVEDDEAARNALGETLLRMNYNILLAEDGARALELFAVARDRIALVISDVVMPRIGGMELLRELRKLNPDVRALLITGYPLGKDARELLEAGRAGWIQKPFDSRTLASRIQSLLRL